MISLALLAAISFDAATIAQTSATLNALGPHPFGSPRNRAAAQFVMAKLQEAGLGQTVMTDFDFEGSPGTNVVASVPGRTDRLIILATHHDSKKDAQDVSDRSRSLSLLVEIGRQASRLRPSRTWILASFDGGESGGEGFAQYLQTLGKARDLVDAVVLLEAAPQETASPEPVLIAPACAGGLPSLRRGMAGRDLISAAWGGIPDSIEVAFDDPGISLLTQPFIRSFRTECDPLAARALAAQIGVIQVGDTSFSRKFLSKRPAAPTKDPALRDHAGARLGEVAFAALQGIDASSPMMPRADSWMVFGRSVLPGWVLFGLGLATLVPGLLALRGGGTRLALRSAYSAILVATLYYEPEAALFVGALPSLVPTSAPRKYLVLALLPLALLLAAGGLGAVRGQVTGSWLSGWIWAGWASGFGLLFASPAGFKKAPAKPRRGKR